MLIDYLVLVMEVFKVHRVPYKFSEPDKALAQASNPKRAKPEESRGSLPKVLHSLFLQLFRLDGQDGE